VLPPLFATAAEPCDNWLFFLVWALRRHDDMTNTPVDYNTAKELLNKLALRNAVIRDRRLAGEMAELDHLLTVLQTREKALAYMSSLPNRRTHIG
jgi:hypothetical protein